MSSGSSDAIGQLIGKNPGQLSDADWIKAALSEKGIYDPLLNNYTEYRAAGMKGPTFTLDGDRGIFTGEAGATEAFIFRLLERGPKEFERRIRRPLELIPQNNFGKLRGDVLDTLIKMYEQGVADKGRLLDYTLVASGALHPWTRQLDESIRSIESKSFSNKAEIVNKVRSVFKDSPLLKTTLSRVWNKRIKKGNMSRQQVNQFIEKYF